MDRREGERLNRRPISRGSERYTVLLNELVEEIENFPLTFRKWQHRRTIDKGKAKVNIDALTAAATPRT